MSIDVATLRTVMEYTDKTGPGIKQTEGGLSQLEGAVKAAKAAIAALGVVEAAKAIVELGTLGAQANRTATAFENISGGASAAAANLAAMDAATGGTLSQMDAMATASKLLQMGLVSNAEELGNFTAMAVTLGTAMGRDVNASIEEFALLMANQSIPRLDTFGISAAKVRVRMEELAASNASLTREQRFNIAVMEEGQAAMARLGGSMDDQMASIERGKAAWADLKVAVGQGYAEAVSQAAGATGGFVRVLADALTRFNEYVATMGTARATLQFWAETLGLVETAQASTTTQIEASNVSSEAMVDVTRRAVESLGAVGHTWDDSTARVNQYNYALESNQQASSDALAQQQALADAVAQARDAALDAASAFLEGAAALGEYSVAQVAASQIDALKTAMEAGTLSKEQYVVAQQSVLTGFGLLTSAEVAAQAQLDTLTQAYITGVIDADTYAQRSLEVKQSLDLVTESETAAAQEAADMATSTMTAADQESLLAQRTAEAKEALYGTSGAMGTLGSSAGAAGGQIDILTGKIIAIPDRVVTVTIREKIERAQAGAGTGAQGEFFQAGGVQPFSGMAMVGERGPELVRLPGGAQVLNNNETRQFISQDTYNFGSNVGVALLNERRRQQMARLRRNF